LRRDLRWPTGTGEAGPVTLRTAPTLRGSADKEVCMDVEPRIRVVIAKPGLDGHDRGVKIVARALRDAGMEVVYTGLHQTPEQIVRTAIQEDAAAIGLSILSGAHMTLFAKVIELLKENDAIDIVVFGGGIIPEADMPALQEMGVARIFTPGATTQEIVEWARSAIPTRV
jgi:methylmalonyl-CoA mutase, C-terminal domain